MLILFRKLSYLFVQMIEEHTHLRQTMDKCVCVCKYEYISIQNDMSFHHFKSFYIYRRDGQLILIYMRMFLLLFYYYNNNLYISRHRRHTTLFSYTYRYVLQTKCEEKSEEGEIYRY